MAKQVSLKAGGSTVFPVDIAATAATLDNDLGMTACIDAAVEVLRDAGYKPRFSAHSEAFNNCITLARLMGYTEFTANLRPVFKVAADILPTSR